MENTATIVPSVLVARQLLFFSFNRAVPNNGLIIVIPGRGLREKEGAAGRYVTIYLFIFY